MSNELLVLISVRPEYTKTLEWLRSEDRMGDFVEISPGIFAYNTTISMMIWLLKDLYATDEIDNISFAEHMPVWVAKLRLWPTKEVNDRFPPGT